jgi:hypothetical protein
LDGSWFQTLATGAGLVLDSEKPNLLSFQTFLVFRKSH